MVEKGADLACKDNYGSSLLHVAARNGYLQIVNYLVNQGVDLEARDNDGNKPIHVAAKNSRSQVVRYLAEQGANLESKDDSGNTPLQVARLSNDIELMEYLELKGQSRKRRSLASQSNVVLPATAMDSATSAARQATSWVSNFSGIFKSIPQLVFSYSDSALTEQAAVVNGTHMPRDDVKIGNVSVDGTLLLCDLIVRKMTRKRHNTLFKGSELLNSESVDRITQAIYKFPSTLERMVATKGSNSTFKPSF